MVDLGVFPLLSAKKENKATTPLLSPRSDLRKTAAFLFDGEVTTEEGSEEPEETPKTDEESENGTYHHSF